MTKKTIINISYLINGGNVLPFVDDAELPGFLGIRDASDYLEKYDVDSFEFGSCGIPVESSASQTLRLIKFKSVNILHLGYVSRVVFDTYFIPIAESFERKTGISINKKSIFEFEKSISLHPGLVAEFALSQEFKHIDVFHVRERLKSRSVYYIRNKYLTEYKNEFYK